MYDISTLVNGDSKKLLHDGDEDIKIIYRDECLAFMSNGSGHANIYERIRMNSRLQKYLALRIAYAINPKLCYEDIKDPIPPFAAKDVLEKWQQFPEAVQEAFLSCFTKGKDGRISMALEVEGSPGITVFTELLKVLEDNGIKIIYHEPGMIPLGKIRKYMKDSDKAG